MNVEDRFVQFKVVLSSKLALRSELHSVRLRSANDDGVAPSSKEPSVTWDGLGLARKVGVSLDLSSEYAVSASTTLSFYGGHWARRCSSGFCLARRWAKFCCAPDWLSRSDKDECSRDASEIHAPGVVLKRTAYFTIERSTLQDAQTKRILPSIRV
jgi:hypothetical protein